MTPELVTSWLGLRSELGPLLASDGSLKYALIVAGERPGRSAICAIDSPSASRKCSASATARRRSAARSTPHAVLRQGGGFGEVEAAPSSG